MKSRDQVSSIASILWWFCNQQRTSREHVINRPFRVCFPIVDTDRTFCTAPVREIRAVFEAMAKYHRSVAVRQSHDWPVAVRNR